jgi:hypothetical protein
VDQTPEITDLLSASKLVEALVSGNLDFQQFVRLYDNYYYVAALDGHEGGAEYLKFLEENRSLVDLHEQVQMVLDKVYVSPAGENPVPAPAGRLGPREAEQEIVKLAGKTGLSGELRLLDLKHHG